MDISRRKNDHLSLTKHSQVSKTVVDDRFNYEPLLSSHPTPNEYSYSFLGKKISGPIFLSSITGGSREGEKINRRIGTAAKELNLPMGLGSIRAYLEGRVKRSYNLRDVIGDNIQLFGNIGIAQLELMLLNNSLTPLLNSIDELKLNGLIIHINPLHEWVQPEGDRLTIPPINILKEIVPELKCKTIIKEVGCGFGPESLEMLLKLPIDVIDFAGFGGTNFTKLELLRSESNIKDVLYPLINIGNTPENMIKNINSHLNNGIGINKEFIISGGIRNFLDGYYYNSILNAPSIYGYAGKLVKYAKKSEKILIEHLKMEIEAYSFSRKFLKIKDKELLSK